MAAVRHMLLQATWQVTEDVFSRAPPDPRYERYAAEALTAFEAVLSIEDGVPDQRVTDQFVAGELQRRLGQFGEARNRFEVLFKHPAVAETEWLSAVQLELRLIDSQDSKRHAFPAPSSGRSPEEKKARSAAFSRCTSASDPRQTSECATRLGDCVRGHDGMTPESKAALISCLNEVQL